MKKLEPKEGGKTLDEVLGRHVRKMDPTGKRQCRNNGIRLTPGSWTEEPNLTPRPRGRRRTIVIIEE